MNTSHNVVTTVTADIISTISAFEHVHKEHSLEAIRLILSEVEG